MEDKQHKPSKFFLRFLEWFCPPQLYEGIEGDLIEQFEANCRAKGERYGQQQFAWSVIKFFRPSIVLRNKFTIHLIDAIMWRSYFTITVRSVLKNKGYSFINILGLSLGIAVCLLTFNFVRFEQSYDNMHPDGDRMYRLNQTNIWDPAGGVFGSNGPAVAFALKEDFAEIDEILRINTPYGKLIRYERPDGSVVAFNEESILAADSNFFSFFDFKLKEGSPQRALYGKDKVVLSEEAASRLFGDEPALGKIIHMGDEKIPVEVTGVIKRQPANVHFHFDYLLSIYTNRNIKQFEWSWVWTQVVTYIKLKPDADPVAFNEKLKTFADRHAPAALKKIGIDYHEFIKDKKGWIFSIQPVRDIYLHSARIGNRIGPVGDITYVYILGVVSIFILLIAMVNFVNLSTARGATRAKEVGVKKTLGLMRNSLMTQFQVEHILISVVSLLFGIALMELLRRILQPLVGVSIQIDWSAPYLLFLLLLPIFIGFLAGLYPSFYLTRFSPSQVLKGKIASGFKSSGLRNGLVVFQFTIAIALMAATLIVFQQLQFFKSKNLGFNSENLLIISYADKLGNQLESFRDEVSNYPGVSNASIGMDIRGSFEDIFMREGDDKKVSIAQYKVDEHFFETAGLQLASGRPFDENRAADVNAVIINETTARQFGWTNEQALGKRIIYLGDEVGPQEIIGVTRDFHFQSLRQNIAPVIFYHNKSKMWGSDRIITLRYTGDPKELLDRLKLRWDAVADETPFSYSFYSEEVKNQYEQEQRLGSLFSIFTGLSIIIAIIGLIGLVAYSAEIRKKEIGIRKVFGASTSKIVSMMNRQYIVLIMISIFLATPLTWWALQYWLNTFAYKIEITPLVFVVSGLAELILALCCVGYLSLRAATLNPATVLKDE